MEETEIKNEKTSHPLQAKLILYVTFCNAKDISNTSPLCKLST